MTTNKNENQSNTVIDIFEILDEVSNSTETSNTKSDKYIYHFDFPELLESGFVEISSQKINVHFPDKKISSKYQNTYTNNQNVLLYINNELKFSYDWLPIYTQYDLLRIKDMLTKCYYEFFKFQNTTIVDDDISYCPFYYNEHVKEYKTNNFSYYCFENGFITSMEVNLPKSKPNHTLEPCIQFYIGSNMIFDSQKDIVLPFDEYVGLLAKILYKLIK